MFHMIFGIYILFSNCMQYNCQKFLGFQGEFFQKLPLVAEGKQSYNLRSITASRAPPSQEAPKFITGSVSSKANPSRSGSKLS